MCVCACCTCLYVWVHTEIRMYVFGFMRTSTNNKRSKCLSFDILILVITLMAVMAGLLYVDDNNKSKDLCWFHCALDLCRFRSVLQCEHIFNDPLLNRDSCVISRNFAFISFSKLLLRKTKGKRGMSGRNKTIWIRYNTIYIFILKKK